jgi:hypothetical protein
VAVGHLGDQLKLRHIRAPRATLILAEIHTHAFIALDQSEGRDEFGLGNITAHIDDALARARQILELPPVPPPEHRVPEVARDRPKSQ